MQDGRRDSQVNARTRATTEPEWKSGLCGKVLCTCACTCGTVLHTVYCVTRSFYFISFHFISFHSIPFHSFIHMSHRSWHHSACLHNAVRGARSLRVCAWSVRTLLRARGKVACRLKRGGLTAPADWSRRAIPWHKSVEGGGECRLAGAVCALCLCACVSVRTACCTACCTALAALRLLRCACCADRTDIHSQDNELII